MSWTCGCQPFSCRCSQNVTHCRKEICSTCLFKESIPTIPCGNSKQPLPARSLELPESRVRSAISALNFGCIMPIPSLQLQKKPVLCTEVIVSKIWISGYRLCSQLCYMTAANQRTIVEIEILATVSWTCGCQPFSCRCSQNVTHSRKEIYATCLSKESIPASLFGNSKHPIPTRSYCIMPIPSLQIENKIQSHAQKQRVWSLSGGLQDLLQCSVVIVLSVVLCDCCKPMVQLSRLRFQQQ